VRSCDIACPGCVKAEGVLNDVLNQAEFHFVVTYSDEERWTYQKLMARRYARAQTEGTGFGILLGAIFVLGLVVLGAFKLGLIERSAVRPVLFTAYFAFTTGVVGYYLVMRAYFRKFLRADQRGGTWNCSFTLDGLCYRSETIEVRLAWRAVTAVEDLGKVITMRLGHQAITIPSRIFADDAARAAFVARTSAWSKAAAKQA
jgi:hypothetical protein